jgi:hypothetical protein
MMCPIKKIKTLSYDLKKSPHESSDDFGAPYNITD